MNDTLRKVIAVILTVLLLLSFAGCAGKKEADNVKPIDDTASNAADKEETEDSSEEKTDVLVVYFSATGTTKGVAEQIAAITGGDIYEIKAVVPYTPDDLNYHDTNSRTSNEQNDKSTRPEIGSEAVDLSAYKTVFLGFPIWWGEEPRIMDSFAESYNFEGITVIPFCTSASSGIGRSGPNMEALAKGGIWIEGKRFSGSVSEADLKAWIDGLGIN